jgi:predicted extracellular nuclease
MRSVVLVPVMALGLGLGARQAQAQAADELFFSEYIEGSSFNKALEIFNGTGAAVDLSAYTIEQYSNGSSLAGLTFTLAGTLAHGDVFVFAHSAAAPEILAQADQTSNAGLFNGDDALVLKHGTTMIDVIGQIGFDPGSQWGSGDASTADNTLRRKNDLCVGDPDGANAFAPELEWDGFPNDTFGGLGAHDGCDGGPPPPPPPPPDLVLVHDIQGSGASSPLAGQAVTIEAIVVGDFQASSQHSGFFVQEDDIDADLDPATSEGLFVAAGAGVFDVEVGDLVRVTGTVSESFGMTQLGSATITLLGEGNPLPEASDVVLPFAALDAPEPFEGMLVHFPQQLTVTETFNLGRFGELFLSSGGRLMTPTAVALPGAEAQAVLAANLRNRIMLDDGLSVQNPDPIVYPAPGLTADNTLRSGDSVTGLTGVMHFAFNSYRVQPTETPDFAPTNARTTEPPAVGGNLRVLAYNVLNYFNGDGLGGGFPTPRGANTLAEFVRQRAKIIAGMTALDADIIGLMEIENDGYGPNSAIQDLVNGLNDAAPPGTTYAFINPGRPVVGTDQIAVGIIYRVEAVVPVGTAAILDSSVDPRFLDTRNRPTIAQSFESVASGGVLTVAVNHLKSKGSACADIGDPDTGDGQGNCNLTRLAAAEALVDWLATDPTGVGDTDYLIMGDMNAYAQEDPIRAITDTGFIDSIDAFLGADEAYSFVFDGMSGYLDHGLASPSLFPQITGASEWHINTDEPRVLDYNVEFKTPGQIDSLYDPGPYRSSDHDPLLVGLSLANDPSQVAIADLDGVGAQIVGRWLAVAIIYVHDEDGRPIEGATVHGTWFGDSVTPVSCITGSSGRCSVSTTAYRRTGQVTFQVDDVIHPGAPYEPGANQDPDGDSDGTTLTITQPALSAAGARQGSWLRVCGPCNE